MFTITELTHIMYALETLRDKDRENGCEVYVRTYDKLIAKIEELLELEDQSAIY